MLLYKIISKNFLLRGQETILGNTAYEIGREPSSPQYGCMSGIEPPSRAPQTRASP